MNAPREPRDPTPMTPPERPRRGGDARNERLAAALRANLARRKAQGRARAATDDNQGNDPEEG